MVTLTRKDLALIGAAAGTVDFLAEGKFSAPLARALKKYVAPRVMAAGPRLVGTAAGLAVRGLGAAKFIALRHPVLTGGALVYYGYKNRKELGRLVEQGYDILQDPRIQQDQGLPDFQGPHVQGVLQPIIKPIKKLKNRFSTAVGKGVKALKASSAYGKKGALSSPKAAFKVSTRAASARRQGKKMPKSGPSRIAYKAAKGVYTDEILRRLMK